MTKTRRLGDLQLAIMQTLWQRGEASASQVHEDLLAERGLAPTTIATMLTKMEAKGIIDHRTEGRRFIYRPTVSESEVQRNMVGEITDRLFSGSPAALVSHLLSQHEIDHTELEALKALISQAEAEEAR